MNYDIKIGIKKALKYIVIFVLPALLDRFVIEYPEIAQLSISGLLVIILNWMKIKLGVKAL
jgi:hypothetical protein